MYDWSLTISMYGPWIVRRSVCMENSKYWRNTLMHQSNSAHWWAQLLKHKKYGTGQNHSILTVRLQVEVSIIVYFCPYVGEDVNFV